MMVRINLHGALREADARGYLELEIPAEADIAALRECLYRHLQEQVPQFGAAIARRTAFARGDEILPRNSRIPEHATLEAIPPVSGG